MAKRGSAPGDGLALLAAARAAAEQPDGGADPEALAAFNALVGAGALAALEPHRAWGEIERALAAIRPAAFFDFLQQCGALGELMPELDQMFGVMQPAAEHPEVDAGLHSLLSLEAAAALTGDAAVRFAALLHDLGKAATPREQWPRHDGHEQRGAHAIERLAARLQVPAPFRELATNAARWHSAMHRADRLAPEEARAFRLAFADPAAFDALLLVSIADYRGRKGYAGAAWPCADALPGLGNG
jgi:tRNA nucleotidyltransferase (CCA-adding enzyme)